MRHRSVFLGILLWGFVGFGAAGWADESIPESIAMGSVPLVQMSHPAEEGVFADETVAVSNNTVQVPCQWLCSMPAEDEEPQSTWVTLASLPPETYNKYHFLRIQQGRFLEENTEDATVLQTQTAKKGLRAIPGKVLKILKGKPADDGIYLGLWSRHINTDTDYHTTGNLVGLQRKGIFLGTFANSHAQQTVLVGWARTLFKRQLTKSLAIHGGYKIGPMYGYNYDGVPNFHGLTAMPLATVGLDYKWLGVDLNMPVGSNSFSMNFRLTRIPFLHKKPDQML